MILDKRPKKGLYSSPGWKTQIRLFAVMLKLVDRFSIIEIHLSMYILFLTTLVNVNVTSILIKLDLNMLKNRCSIPKVTDIVLNIKCLNYN